MQAPQTVNMRQETPMDMVAEAAVKDAIALDIPLQLGIHHYYLQSP